MIMCLCRDRVNLFHDRSNPFITVLTADVGTVIGPSRPEPAEILREQAELLALIRDIGSGDTAALLRTLLGLVRAVIDVIRHAGLGKQCAESERLLCRPSATWDSSDCFGNNIRFLVLCRLPDEDADHIAVVNLPGPASARTRLRSGIGCICRRMGSAITGSEAHGLAIVRSVQEPAGEEMFAPLPPTALSISSVRSAGMLSSSASGRCA